MQTEVQRYDDKYTMIMALLSDPGIKEELHTSVGQYFDSNMNFVDENLRRDVHALVQGLVGKAAKKKN